MANELEIPVISDKFLTQLGETIKGLDRLQDSADETYVSLKRAFDDKEVIDFTTSIKSVDKTIDTISDSAKEYEKSLDGVVESQKEWIAGSRKLKDVEQETKKVEKAIEGVSKAQDGIAQNTEKSGGMLQRFIGGIGTAFKGFIVLAIGQKILEYIGTIGQTVREVDKLRQQVALLTNESGDSLNEATAKVRAITDVFPDINPEETLRAAGNASKQLGVDVNTVLDVIGDGLARGANANGEYLSSLVEYSSVAKEAGLSLGQFNEILIKTTEAGIYSDKGIDAVKESTIRLREFTKSTEDALVGAFGEDFTKEIKLQVNSGDTFGAIQKISEGLNDTSLTAQQAQTVIADVFGGPGEDAGIAFLQTIKDIDGNLDKVDGTAGKYIDRQKELLAITIEYEKANAELAEALGSTTAGLDVAFTTIKAVGMRAFVEIIKVVRDDLSPAILNVANTFRSFVDRLGLASKESTLFQSVINGVVGAVKIFSNLLTVVINVANGVANAILWLSENVSVVRAAFDGVGFVVRGFIQLLLNLPEIVEGTANAIVAFFSDLGFNLGQFASNVRDVFSSFGNIQDWLKGNRSLNDGFKDAGKSAATAFSDAFQKELTLKEKLEAELEQLKTVETTLRIQGFNQDADRVKLQIQQIRKQLEELGKPVAPPKIPGADGNNKGLSSEDLKQQEEFKKEAEKLAQERAKVLTELEKQFLEQKKALAKEAEQIELESLEEGAEKIKRRNELVKKEINDREEQLKILKAQVEVRQEIEAGKFTGSATDEGIELEAKRRVSEGLVELEEEQVIELNKIRAVANSTFIDELGKFNEEVYQKNLERFQKQQDSEKSVLEDRLKTISADYEFNRSALEAQKDFLNEKGEIIQSETEQEEQRQRALLSLQADYLQKQIAFYKSLNATQTELVGGDQAVNTVINDLQTQLNAVGSQLKEKSLDTDIDLFKLLGINIDDESKQRIIDGLKSLTDTIGALVTSSIDKQIAEQERLIESYDEAISAREEAIEKEQELQEQGFANNLEVEQSALELLQKQREDAVEKKLQLERRAAAINKAAAIAQILTAQATATANLLTASTGNPLNLLTGGAAGIIQFSAGLVQILATIGSIIGILNSAPKLAKGKAKITDGIPGQDSVLSWLMPGEAIIPEQAAEPNRELMEGLVEGDKAKVLSGISQLMRNFGIDFGELLATVSPANMYSSLPLLRMTQPGAADSSYISMLSEAKTQLRSLEIQQSMLEVSKKSYEQLRQINQNTANAEKTTVLPTETGYTEVTTTPDKIEITHRKMETPPKTHEAALLEQILAEIKKPNKND